MSGEGLPSLEHLDCHALRVGVVAASWHPRVMDGLRVPGSFELPVVALHLAQMRYDAVIALGVVVRGGTPHFEYVCQAATDGLSRVALDTGVPIGFGLLTCDDDGQALDRAGLPESREDKGYEAAQAALHTAVTIRRLRHRD